MYYLSSALRARYLNRVLAPEGEDLSCRDKKGPKETLPGWRDISLRFAPLPSGRPTAHPCTGGRRAGSIPAPLLACGQRLARSGAPYGARRSHRGLAKEAVLPRRRASVEEGPKSSPTGHRRDSVRAHPAQGRAVCAPPEANRDARNPRSGRRLSGQNGFGDFPRKESHPGVQGAERPASSLSTSPKAIHH